MLLDHLEGRGEAEAYDKPITADLCLTVGVSGLHESSVLRHGRWRSAVYQPGSVGLTAGGEGERLRWRSGRSGQAFSVVSLYLPTAFLIEADEQFRRPGQTAIADLGSVRLPNDRLVAETSVALLRAMRNGASDQYAECAARWLAAHLVGTSSGRFDPLDDKRSPGFVSDARLARVIEFMTWHYDRTLTIRELSSVAGISPFHFNRVFRRATGTTVHAFLTNHRMQAAEQMLMTTDLTLGEIARACGYSRTTAFATAFGRMSGQAPSAFRKRHRR